MNKKREIEALINRQNNIFTRLENVERHIRIKGTETKAYPTYHKIDEVVNAILTHLGVTLESVESHVVLKKNS